VDDDIADTARDVPVFASHREALTWCQAEEVALLWAIRTASARGWQDLTVAMACYIFGYYIISGDPGPFEMTQRLGADSARQLGNDLAYATLQSGRGVALSHAGNYDEAIDCFRETLHVRQRLGDRFGEAGSRQAATATSRSRSRPRAASMRPWMSRN
jgi:hypothetical protein